MNRETPPFQITWQFMMTAVFAGVLLGAWTGGIVGAAIRLAMPQYKKVDTPQVASKGDVMLAVQADNAATEARARSIMREYGAVRFEEFKEKWDNEVWSVLNEGTPQVQ